METPAAGTADEVKRLQRCVDELAGALAPPAAWIGRESPSVATALLDVVLRILDLDFAYARVDDPIDGAPMEWVRRRDGPVGPARAREVREALQRLASDDASTMIRPVSDPWGGGVVSLAAFRLGSQRSVGLFAAGSRRTGFPTEAERLVLQVAANQAALAVLEARQSDDRSRAEERMREVALALREEADRASRFEKIVGASAPLRTVLSYVAKVAPTESTVLVTGETGTGKELIARAIHKGSRRASRGFVSVNCAAIPQSLIASELFGHERGAFTGALQRRIGRFELAEGGTIFLDEVGELPPETQLALLRVLQEREFERVGGARPVRADVRVLAATNRDLRAAMEAGSFREDLYYRLNVFPVAMPSLRERRGDIPLLVQYFVDRYARDAGKRIQRLAPESVELLQSYAWPGNVRELQNVIERAVITSRGGRLNLERALPATGVDDEHARPAPERTGNAVLTAHELARLERENLRRALEATGWQIAGESGAARLLGLAPSTLASRMKALRLRRHR